MILYLAGPMRGIPQNNFPAFDAAAELLRKQDHIVFNPADHDREMGQDENSNVEADPKIFQEMFRWDLGRVMEVEGVVFLPGWQNSRGACAERTVAHYLGVPCFDMGDDGMFSLQVGYQEPRIVWVPIA